MTDQTQGNAKKPNRGTGSSSRADQPTAVSGNAQSQGNQSTSGNKPTQAGQGAQSAANDLKQRGSQVTNEAKHAASDVANQAKSQAVHVANEAQEQATHFLGEQKGMAAQRIEGVAQALRQAGQGFEDQDESTLAQYTNSFAGQLEGFSNSLRDREVGAILNDAKQLAQRQPEVFVVGALAAGFLLGRFLKSSSRSSSRDYGQYSDYDSRYPSQSYGQMYGQTYDQSYGPEYSNRESRQANYGQTYGQNYSETYGQEYGRRYEQNYEREDDRNQYFGQGGGGQSGREQSGGGESTGQTYNQPTGQTRETGTNIVTPLGDGQPVSPGQIERQQGQKGQEFGQGETQVTNPNENLPPSESDQQSDLGRPNRREEGGHNE